MSLPRRFAVALAIVSAVVATSCSKDFPSKADFVSTSKESYSTDAVAALTDAGLTPDAANTLIEQQLGCLYDAISADDELVDRYLSDSDSDAVLTEAAADAEDCTKQLNPALLEAVADSTK